MGFGFVWQQRSKETPEKDCYKEQLLKDLVAAKGDWQASLNYFEESCPSENVDYGIYRIAASQKRFVFLLQEAKKNKLKVDAFDLPKQVLRTEKRFCGGRYGR